MTAPTLPAGASRATSANVAPVPAPSAAAIVRNAIVPSGSSGGAVDCTAAHTMVTSSDATMTRTPPSRSDSHPPNGRIATASTTNPAIRLDASACDRSYCSFR